MVQTIALDANKHAVTMLRKLKEMRQSEKMCDFIVKVGKDEYHAHKYILSAGSDYFEAMLRHDTVEARDGVVDIKNVDFECVKNCIDFLYCGSFDIPDGKITQFMHVAVMLQLEDVKNATCESLRINLAVENFYDARNIAEMYCVDDLFLKCITFYEENFAAIASQPGFAHEKQSYLIRVLKSKRLTLEAQEKLEICLKWARESTATKKNGPIDWLNHIALEEISADYLRDLLLHDPIVADDFNLYKLINKQLLNSTAKQQKSPPVALSSNTDHDATVSMNAAKPTIGTDSWRIILFDATGDCLRSYDPATNKVERCCDATFTHLSPFTLFSVVSIDSYIYILCGEDQSVLRLNMKDRHSCWEPMQSMIHNHGGYPPAVVLSGAIFVVGSSAWRQPSRLVEKFIPDQESWTELGEKPEGVGRAALVSLDGSIYCIGGQRGYYFLRTFSKFTPSSSEWVTLEPMKIERSRCAAVAFEQNIFVTGGSRYSGWWKDVECYNIISEKWSSLPPMSEPNSPPSAHFVNGRIFVVSRRGYQSGFEIYDAANGRWSNSQWENYNCDDGCLEEGPSVNVHGVVVARHGFWSDTH